MSSSNSNLPPDPNHLTASSTSESSSDPSYEVLPMGSGESHHPHHAAPGPHHSGSLDTAVSAFGARGHTHHNDEDSNNENASAILALARRAQAAEIEHQREEATTEPTGATEGTTAAIRSSTLSEIEKASMTDASGDGNQANTSTSGVPILLEREGGTGREYENGGANRNGQRNATFASTATGDSNTSAAKTRWQSAVRRTMQVQHLATASNYSWSSNDEPGVDPRRVDYPDLKSNVLIEVVDYDEMHVKHDVMANEEFIAWLEKGRGRVSVRPAWSKVRWINVNGLSWDVIKSLSLTYDLHPLAIEDTLQHGHSARAKADFFAQHLFLNLVMHSVVPPSESTQKKSRGGFSSFLSSRRRKDNEATVGIGDDSDSENELPITSEKTTREKGIKTGIQMSMGAVQRDEPRPPGKRLKRREGTDLAQTTVHHLTSQFKVNIISNQLNIFLMRDGTVISIFQDGGGGDVAPLFNRLKESQTLLRMTADASMLLQGILDVVADNMLEITESFRKQLTILEGQVLVKADISTVRHLHIMSADLLLLKRRLSPFTSVLHALQNHDAHDAFALPSRRTTSGLGNGNGGHGRGSESTLLHPHHPTMSRSNTSGSIDGLAGSEKKPPIISRQTEIYLNDTMDHIDSVLSSLELFSGLASNLVDFTFNTISWEMNDNMMNLSVVTVLFLPLTFLTGYFGMNFGKFEGVIGESDSVTTFWKIAVPFSVIFCILCGWGYLTRKFGALRRKFLRFQVSHHRHPGRR